MNQEVLAEFRHGFSYVDQLCNEFIVLVKHRFELLGFTNLEVVNCGEPVACLQFYLLVPKKTICRSKS